MQFKELWNTLAKNQSFLEQSKEEMFYSGVGVALDLIAHAHPKNEAETLSTLYILIEDLQSSLKDKDEQGRANQTNS